MNSMIGFKPFIAAAHTQSGKAQLSDRCIDDPVPDQTPPTFPGKPYKHRYTRLLLHPSKKTVLSRLISSTSLLSKLPGIVFLSLLRTKFWLVKIERNRAKAKVGRFFIREGY
jgi:hypothetical protein